MVNLTFVAKYQTANQKNLWIHNLGNWKNRSFVRWSQGMPRVQRGLFQKEEQKWLIFLWIIQLLINRKFIWWFDPFIFTTSFNYDWFFFPSMLENRINGMIDILLLILVPYLNLHIFLFYFSNEDPSKWGKLRPNSLVKSWEDPLNKWH